MINRRSRTKVLAVVATFVMIAAACGGSEESATDPGGANDTPTVTGEIPTTAPVEVPADDSAGDGAITASDDGSDPANGASDEDPWEVSVLHVNDDVQIIPVFDAPNGNNITLFDQNEVDGVELEYPLLAETAFGNRLALLVDEYDSSGNWAKVKVPIRPNGATAWVQTAFFTAESHNYHITINVTENKVYVFKGEEELIPGGQVAVSGREGRETPLVRSYIDEKIRGETISPAYGDWILSIAAFSEALGTFGGGGMPKLALHGTNQPELMGQYVSSGCVRIPNEVVSFIADTVPVGTIVDIVA